MTDIKEAFDQTTTHAPNPKCQIRLTPMGHILCGWPLILIGVGGVVLGGGVGGLAYGINTFIYKSKMHSTAKVLLIIVTGLIAPISLFWVCKTLLILKPVD